MKKIDKVDIPGAETLTAAELNRIVIESESHSQMQNTDKTSASASTSPADETGAMAKRSPHSLSSLKDLHGY